MIRHCIILMTTIAFTNLLLGGCTKIVTRQFYEVSNNPATNLRAVITKQGEEVKFDRSGGEVDTANQLVTGLSNTGQQLTILPENIDHLKVKKAAVIKTALLTTLTITALLLLSAKHELEEGWNN